MLRLSEKLVPLFSWLCFLISVSANAQVNSKQQKFHPMPNVSLSKSGELIIKPSSSSSKNDFDFLMGEHKIHHKKLKERLSGSNEWMEFDGTHRQQGILNGIGNIEEHKMIATDGKHVEGMALRLFNPDTKLWSIYWSDSNSGVLDIPVIGSFENGIGYFFAKDVYNNKPILLQFKWDATNTDEPVWSQAFSTDNGKSWEWNWYMYFEKEKRSAFSQIVPSITSTDPDSIGVIELRNYLLKQGKRDSFISYFEEHFIVSQRIQNGYPLAQYRVKDNVDNFFWIRGFENLKSRSTFLPTFYYGDYWKRHREPANSMIANNDNVHLLKPLMLKNDVLVSTPGVKSSELASNDRIAVVDFYTANTKLNQLKELFGKTYLPLLKDCGIFCFTIWESVLEENDFPQLPVFQDKNLLVMITFYRNELDYAEAMKTVESKTTDNIKAALLDAITKKQTIILYPTEMTRHQ